MLSAIVPISRMNGRLQLLSEWADLSTAMGLEIILVHDKQDELTEIELDSIVKKIDHPLLKLYTGEFRSPGLARNFGLAQATHEWVTFWDSDDEPFPDKYITLLDQIKDEPHDIGIGNFVSKDFISLRENKHTHNGNILNTINAPGLWRYVIKRERIGTNKFESMRMGEDQLFLASLNIKENDVFFTKEILYRYSTNFIGQLTSNQKSVRELIFAKEKLRDMNNKSQEAIPFNLAMYLRMNLTLLKIGSAGQRRSALIEVSRYLSTREKRLILIRTLKGLTR